MTILKRGLCALLILMLACGLALAEEEIPEEAKLIPDFTLERSEERRVGKECRYRWSPDH